VKSEKLHHLVNGELHRWSLSDQSER